MSDEEEYEEEEIEEEEVEESEAAEPVAAEPEESKEEAHDEQHEEKREEKKRREIPTPEEKAPEEMSEAEAAVAAARKRKEEEDAIKLLDFEQQRKLEKERIEQELRELREKQQIRRQEREQEEREWAERMKQAEEKRRQEEEAYRQQVEAEKQRRLEEKMKKQAMMSGMAVNESGVSFVVQKGSNVFGQQSQTQRGPSKEQIAEMKKAYITQISKRPTISDMMPLDLKEAIKRLYQKILRLEGEKYDLEQRSSRQEYDMKELRERELQHQRNKALKMGIEPSEASDLKHPPKVLTASKFDRQVDRRTYVDKRVLFEKPYVPPEPKIARGTARPPPEWGRKKNAPIMDELEQIRKNLEPPKYVEQAPIEGAKPPVDPIPLQIPEGGDDEEPPSRSAAAEPEPEAVEAEA